MGLRGGNYRFKEFEELYKLYPAGIFTDLDALKTFMSFIKNNTADTLKNKINEMEIEIEKENDIIEIIEKKFEDEVESIENIAFNSNVDYIDYYSSKNALNLVYNSILITLCSFLETRLRLICQLLDFVEKSKKTTIDNYKGCLKSKGVSFRLINPTWEKMKSYITLRNLIVHKEKDRVKTDSRDYNDIKQIKYLNVDEEEGAAIFIIDDPRLLEECFDTVKGILEFICYKEVKTT